jgi:hypothetical protein
VFVVSAARIPFLHFHLVGPVRPFFLFSALCVAFALYVGLLAAIGFGRRWARTVLVVLYVLTLPQLWSSAARQLHGGVPGLALFVATKVVYVVAIGLLFGRSAREWFAQVDPHTGRRPK